MTRLPLAATLLAATLGTACAAHAQLALPFAGSAFTNPPDAVFKITNTGAGYAVLGVSDFNGIGVGGFCTTTGVNYGVWGQSDSDFGTGVYGYAPAATGSTYGGKFISNSRTGFGVYAEATSTSSVGVSTGGQFVSNGQHGVGVSGFTLGANSVGGMFQSNGTSGMGLIGNAMATTGTTYAGYFYNTSTAGTGVFARAAAASGATYGGSFENASTGGVGLMASATASSGLTIGGRFESASPTGIGLFSWTKATSGSSIAGFFQTDSAGGIGVRGHASAATGTNFGGRFSTSSTSGLGVAGYATATSGSPAAVYGECQAPSGSAVRGFNLAQGSSGFIGNGIYGVHGISNAASGMGVRGESRTSTGGIGVYGSTTNSTGGFGVYSLGRFGASGTKLFQIDHPMDPANKFLNHYCTESPEVLNAYRGTVTLDESGSAWVQLPPYFARINKDPSYTLTAVGAAMPLLHIAREIDERTLAAGAAAAPTDSVPACSFRIEGGAPGARVSWRVEAVRNDPWVRAYGAPVETEKQGSERGVYQHPELYGQPEKAGLAHQSDQ